MLFDLGSTAQRQGAHDDPWQLYDLQSKPLIYERTARNTRSAIEHVRSIFEPPVAGFVPIPIIGHFDGLELVDEGAHAVGTLFLLL